MSEDIARAVLQRAINADENLSEDAKRFIDRYIADPTTPGPSPVQTSLVDLIDRLKPDFEKRPAAPSVRRKAILPLAGKDHDLARGIATPATAQAGIHSPDMTLPFSRRPRRRIGAAMSGCRNRPRMIPFRLPDWR